MENFKFKDLDGEIEERTRLDEALNIALDLMKKHEALKKETTDCWNQCEAALDALGREMKRHGISSFRGLKSKSLAFFSETRSATFDPAQKDVVVNFLKNNQGGGVISTQIRSDSLAKWLKEWEERGNKVPSYIEVKKYEILKIRRS